MNQLSTSINKAATTLGSGFRYMRERFRLRKFETLKINEGNSYPIRFGKQSMTVIYDVARFVWGSIKLPVNALLKGALALTHYKPTEGLFGQIRQCSLWQLAGDLVVDSMAVLFDSTKLALYTLESVAKTIGYVGSGLGSITHHLFDKVHGKTPVVTYQPLGEQVVIQTPTKTPIATPISTPLTSAPTSLQQLRNHLKLSADGLKTQQQKVVVAKQLINELKKHGTIKLDPTAGQLWDQHLQGLAAGEQQHQTQELIKEINAFAVATRAAAVASGCRSNRSNQQNQLHQPSLVSVQ